MGVTTIRPRPNGRHCGRSPIPTRVVHEPSDGAAAPAPEGDWVEPDAEGGCPLSHPVKVKLRSGIYHVPGGLVYDRTNADRCYVDPDAAEGDGYRASKA